MLGRISVRVLVGLLLLASLMAGQAVDGRRGATDTSNSEKSREVTFDQKNGSTAYGASVSARESAVIPAPEFPGSPVLPVLAPEPLPWRPPVVSAPPGFAWLTHRAGIIFSGTVIKIEPISVHAPREAVGTVAITFHVEHAIRGTTTGESLTVTQWIGLWSSRQRYRIGERVLLFLYPPSRAGLTSSVGAAMGRFAIDSLGGIRLSPQQILAFRTDPVLGGKSRLRMSDFASAVLRAGEEK